MYFVFTKRHEASLPSCLISFSQLGLDRNLLIALARPIAKSYVSTYLKPFKRSLEADGLRMLVSGAMPRFKTNCRNYHERKSPERPWILGPSLFPRAI